MSNRRPCSINSRVACVQVARNGKNVWAAAGARHLHRERLDVGVPDLVVERRLGSLLRSRRQWPESRLGAAQTPCTLDNPTIASSAASANPRRWPASSSTAFARACDACRLTLSSGASVRGDVDAIAIHRCSAPPSPPNPRPRGMGAPVMISTAWPGRISPANDSPARTSPITSKSPGKSADAHRKSIAHRTRDRRIIAIGWHRLGKHAARDF